LVEIKISQIYLLKFSYIIENKKIFLKGLIGVVEMRKTIVSKKVRISIIGYIHEIKLSRISEDAFYYWENNYNLENYVLGFSNDK